MRTGKEKRSRRYEEVVRRQGRMSGWHKVLFWTDWWMKKMGMGKTCCCCGAVGTCNAHGGPLSSGDKTPRILCKWCGWYRTPELCGTAWIDPKLKAWAYFHSYETDDEAWKASVDALMCKHKWEPQGAYVPREAMPFDPWRK